MGQAASSLRDASRHAGRPLEPPQGDVGVIQEDVVDVLVAVRLVAGERPLEATHADRGPEIPTAILRVDEEFELLRPPGTRVGNRRSRFRNVGRRASRAGRESP